MAITPVVYIGAAQRLAGARSVQRQSMGDGGP
jgi:hypothetical protein